MSVPARTTAAAVQGVLNQDYDSVKSPNTQPYIDSASSLVDQVVIEAAKRNFTLTTVQLELIERWLAAHMYALSDQPYSSRNTEKASGQFQGQKLGQYLELTKYGMNAMAIDVSGALKGYGMRQVAHAQWLGKPSSAQIPINQRN